MKASNEGTDHNRTIRLTDIPATHPKDFIELTIVVNYQAGGQAGRRADGSDDYTGDGEKAVCLDGFVIPYIIKAINTLAVVDGVADALKADKKKTKKFLKRVRPGKNKKHG